MTNYPPLKDRTSYLLMRFALQCRDMEAKIRRYGTDVPIHEAEIHMLKAIKQTGLTHVSGLAKKLGVTKGAVSQIIMKLHKKGLVTKGTDADNQSKLNVSLTPKGEAAYARHEELHQQFDDMTEEELARYPEEFRNAVKTFLKDMLNRMDTWSE